MSDLQHEIERRSVDGRLPCMAAFTIAEELAMRPDEVREQSDRSEIRIAQCQLGLFGYSPERKIVKAADNISGQLRHQLQQSVIDGKISCAACWDIGKSLGMKKTAVAAACEYLGLKIGPCQLGAF